MVRELQALEEKELEQLRKENNENLPIFYVGDTKFFVLENKLLRAMMLKDGIELSDASYIRNWKNLLRTCTADNNKFIISEPNPNFKKPDTREEAFNDDVVSQHLIRVGADKGSELLNGWYFWCKYIPEQLRPVEQIFVQVVITILTALLTSGIIWLLLWNAIMSKLGL